MLSGTPTFKTEALLLYVQLVTHFYCEMNDKYSITYVPYWVEFGTRFIAKINNIMSHKIKATGLV